MLVVRGMVKEMSTIFTRAIAMTFNACGREVMVSWWEKEQLKYFSKKYHITHHKNLN